MIIFEKISYKLTVHFNIIKFKTKSWATRKAQHKNNLSSNTKN